MEITAPVGNWESLQAAIRSGADSVYFGVGLLNMRARSSMNFTLRDLVRITRTCHRHKVAAYLTLNIVIYDQEIREMKRVLDSAKKNGVDAVIASDQAVVQYARSIGMPVHMSTQTNISNLEAVRYWSQFADVMVIARELSLDQVANIARAVKKQPITGPSGNLVKIEIFAHGALCMAISGKCYLSLDHYNASANRGACYQLCRRPYRVTDADGEIELAVDNQYIMSPKDLCTIGFLDKIAAAGVSLLKIEGRGRSPEYVQTVVSCYREAIEALRLGTYSADKTGVWMDRLRKVYNRGFWEGYYLGQKMGEWAVQHGSAATETKEYIGKVTNYFTRVKVAEIKMESGELSVGDKIYIQGPTTGVIEMIIPELRVGLLATTTTRKGEVCSLPVNTYLRRADKIYKIIQTSDIR
ncbi:MAG TPA: peptidase U32 family protein [Bacteroidales bacterium]|nr:peptidase U32 family protein [Bacteroidales bacterium]HPT09752.1 peptidase U32 family protein [Bacteroidales bacterium]